MKHVYRPSEAKRYVSSFIDRLFTIRNKVKKIMANKYGIEYPLYPMVSDTEICFDGNFGSMSSSFVLTNYVIRNWNVDVYCSSKWGYTHHKDRMDIHIIYTTYDGHYQNNDHFIVYPHHGKADRDRALRKIEACLIKHCLKLDKDFPNRLKHIK